MKNLVWFLFFGLFSFEQNAQTHLFAEYYAQYTSFETSDNKNDRYKWLYKDGRHYMFFPQTPDGLANLHDKLSLILQNSGLDMDEPMYTQNVIPVQYEDLIDYGQISELINSGVIRTHARWELNERQLGVTTSSDFYIIFVKNLN